MKCLADMESGVIWRSEAVGQPGGRIRQTHRNYVAKEHLNITITNFV